MTDFEKIIVGALITAFIGTAGTAFWWILNKISSSTGALHKRLDHVEKTQSDHALAASREFVRRDDFEKFDEKLTRQLEKISDKIDKLNERKDIPG